MELLQLRYFYESAKTENFAKVANKYQVPTPSVSASVRRLESELGCPLFDRSSNRITLNDSGKKFMYSLSIIFEELDQALDTLAFPDINDTREIRVAICALRKDVTTHIIDYQTTHPNVSFKTFIGPVVDNGADFDIIIDEQSKLYAGFDSFDLCKTKILLKVAHNHPLYGQKLSMYQLRNQPFLSMGPKGNLHSILVSSCKKAGFAPNIVAEINDLRCYMNFVRAGCGIGIGRNIRTSAKLSQIVSLDVCDFNETQTICCYFKKKIDYGNAKQFLNFLKQIDFQSMFL